MSRPLEHNYIGLSEFPSMENPDKIQYSQVSTFSNDNEKNSSLKTELRLGLPGCESPERKPEFGVTIFGKELEGKTTQQNGYLMVGSNKTCAFGSKRGFSDACDKWVLCINRRSETNFGKEVVAVPSSSKPVMEKQSQEAAASEDGGAPVSKAQVVGWPPIRSFRKNTMASTSTKNNGHTEDKSVSSCHYVKVSMDGAPYLRKVDLQTYRNYNELSLALEKMFSCFITGQCGSHRQAKLDGPSENYCTEAHHRSSEYVLTYEDKDGDWMLVGDVPWKMFTENCRKLRIMKGSEAIGLAPSARFKPNSET